jgi:hypothetical protein
MSGTDAAPEKSETAKRKPSMAPSLTIEDALGPAVTVVGLITGVIALIEITWWVGVLCLVTIGVGTCLRFWTRVQWFSQLGIAVGAGIVGTLAINGAVAAWPAEEYSGNYIVVGALVQVARVGPSARLVEAPGHSYEAGETVVVMCRARDWDHPSRYWYRLRETDSFLPADSLAPSPATQPGLPPGC